MSITCGSVLNMPELKKDIRLLAGSRGLSNAIRWTHVLESVEAIQFLVGNELAFLTGIMVGNNAEQLVPVIEQLASKHVAGLVVNTGKFITKVPKKAIERANQLDLPLFELPWEIRLVDVTKWICTSIVENGMEESSISYLLEKILLSDENHYEDYLYSAEFYGYDLSGPMGIVNIEFSNLQTYAEKLGRVGFINCQHQIRYLINNILEQRSQKALSMWKGNHFVLAVPVDVVHELEQTEAIAFAISKEMELKMEGLLCYIGLGGCYEQIDQLKKSYSEAQLALKLAKDNPDKPYMFYRNAGIYKFLNKVTDRSIMAEFYMETLGVLLQYDDENNTKFTETLRVFLEEGENTASTIQRLFIHRNTLQYRLRRIEEVLQQSLKNAEVKISLQIAFKIQMFFEYEGLSLEKEGRSTQNKVQ